jgi:hypothetical protein
VEVDDEQRTVGRTQRDGIGHEQEEPHVVRRQHRQHLADRQAVEAPILTKSTEAVNPSSDSALTCSVISRHASSSR